MRKFIIVGLCMFLILLIGCSVKPIGDYGDIGRSINSTHYSQTEDEIERLCIEKCGGKAYYFGFECPCNYCKCKCGGLG